MSGIALVRITPATGRYDAGDERWREQVADLVHDLRVQTEALVVERVPVPGTKGTIDQLLLTLGSSGVFTAAVEVLRAWLARDQTRSVALTYQDSDGKEQRLNVTAAHADRNTLAPVIAAVARQIESSR